MGIEEAIKYYKNYKVRTIGGQEAIDYLRLGGEIKKHLKVKGKNEFKERQLIEIINNFRQKYGKAL